jgi:hypothetical protein
MISAEVVVALEHALAWTVPAALWEDPRQEGLIDPSR